MISILDYSMGNILSVERKIIRLGEPCTVIRTADEIKNAEKIILPGVGHFGKAMDHLRKLDLIGPLNEFALEHHKPILGICLGMQLMTASSEEGGHEGLGWFNARTIRFRVMDHLKYKVPHTGWNTINPEKAGALTRGLTSESSFYFVHAYHVSDAATEEVLATTIYEYPFVSALSKGNMYGVQFHPEKSHDAGNVLLKNFINLSCTDHV